jgi:uncharacterized membrane protein
MLVMLAVAVQEKQVLKFLMVMVTSFVVVRMVLLLALVAQETMEHQLLEAVEVVVVPLILAAQVLLSSNGHKINKQ